MTKLGNYLDFQQNEIRNPRLQNLASAPGSPVSGQCWYNTTSGRIEFYGASSTIDPTARANHTGTQLAATISDLSSAVTAFRLDQLAAPSADVSLNSHKITNLSAPTTSSDATTKGYVDGLVNGTDWKQSVRAGTTANTTLSGLLTIDGITLAVGESVLVKNQTTASQNGIYLAASGAWTRRSDVDATTLTAGAAVMITEGSTLADSQWRLTTDDPITVGTTSLAWAQIGASTSYTGGTGITIAGNVVSLDTTVAARRYATNVGDGSSTSIAVTHALGTLDVHVEVYENSGGASILCDVVHTSTSVITLGFSVAPASAALRAVVVG